MMLQNQSYSDKYFHITPFCVRFNGTGENSPSIQVKHQWATNAPEQTVQTARYQCLLLIWKKQILHFVKKKKLHSLCRANGSPIFDQRRPTPVVD
jgi:hypothetical protein